MGYHSCDCYVTQDRPGGWRETLLLALKTWATELSEGQPLDAERDPCQWPAVKQGSISPTTHVSPGGDPKLKMEHCWHLDSALTPWSENLVWPCLDFWPEDTVRWYTDVVLSHWLCSNLLCSHRKLVEIASIPFFLPGFKIINQVLK